MSNKDRLTYDLSCLFRVMKLTTFLLLITFLSVNASAYSQATRLDLKVQGTTIKDVLNRIENQSKFFFMYNDRKIDVERKVNLDLNQVNVEEVLKTIFKDTNTKFIVKDRQIILYNEGEEDFSGTNAQQVSQQKKSAFGKVTDSTGNSLPGVSVVVKGTTIGTITDNNGSYTLSGFPENSILQFSFVGMKSKEFKVGNIPNINVVLEEEAIGLEEVVAIGYGSSKVKDLTSAISSVNTDDLDMSGTDSNIDQMLVGRVPGLNMVMNSAQPGANVDINIRGSISPNGNNAPLYVIDGVPVTTNTSNIGNISGSGNVVINTGLDQSPLNTINPNDIQSINVLKDASAAAIYGSAAANGVIIITTKRGVAGKPTISYDGSQTISSRKSYGDHLYDAQSFMKYHNLYTHERQAVINNVYPYRNSSGYTDYNKDGKFDIADYNAAAGSVSDAYTATDISNAKTFNWPDYIMDDAWATEHNLSIRGGTETSKYFGSYNYYKNDGLLKNSGLARNSFRFNFDQNFLKWLDFNVSVNYSVINTDNESSGDILPGSGAGTTITGAFAMTPYIDNSIDPATGSFTKGLNQQQTSPAGLITYLDHTKNQRLFLSPNFTVTLSKGLTFKAVQGYDSQFSRRDAYIPASAGNYQVPAGQATVSFSESVNSSTEGFFNYNKVKGVSRIDAVLGAGYYFSSGKNAVAQSAGFFTDTFLTDKLQAGSSLSQRFNGSSHTEVTKLSQFGRITYTYKDKYTLLGTVRRDGSSFFAANHKWGIFPSLSGAWRISEETWAHSKWLTNLKFRAGYGTAGNEPRSSNSLALYAADEVTGAQTAIAYGVITAGGYLGGVQLSTVANPDLKWETDKTVNVGLDFGLYDQKISGSVDFFNRSAMDLLDYKNLPSNGIIDKVIANVGATQARGWEVLINSVNIRKPNFNWDTEINFSRTKYNWTERNSDLVLFPWVSTHAEMSAVYGWSTNGIFKSYDEINAYTNSSGVKLQPKAMPGNIKYVDFNSDGVLDNKDNHQLGVRDAPWKFGMNNTFSYKNVSLSFYLYGQAGAIRERSDQSTILGAQTAQANGWSDNVDRYWSNFNPNGDWPGLGSDFTSTELRSAGTSDFWYMKSDYIKLRYVTLNYNFSKELVYRLGLGSLGISVTGQNLLTITGYKGYDPEVSINSYPQCYSFTFAVKTTF